MSRDSARGGLSSDGCFVCIPDWFMSVTYWAGAKDAKLSILVVKYASLGSSSCTHSLQKKMNATLIMAVVVARLFH